MCDIGHVPNVSSIYLEFKLVTDNTISHDNDVLTNFVVHCIVGDDVTPRNVYG